MTESDENDSPKRFAVRIDPDALQEIEAAEKWLAGLAGDSLAAEWLEGLQQELAKLVAGPRQFAIVPEQKYFSRETRHLVYRRSGGSVAYRMIYFIDDNGQDGPTVTVAHVRHAAARPIGRKRARKIETGEE